MPTGYRLTNVGKWNDDLWFKNRITPDARFLFLYICECCDITGLIELDIYDINRLLGLDKDKTIKALYYLKKKLEFPEDTNLEKLKKDDFIKELSNKIEDPEYYLKIWIKNFLKHQNSPLSLSANSHISIIKKLVNISKVFNENSNIWNIEIVKKKNSDLYTLKDYIEKKITTTDNDVMTMTPCNSNSNSNSNSKSKKENKNEQKTKIKKIDKNLTNNSKDSELINIKNFDVEELGIDEVSGVGNMLKGVLNNQESIEKTISRRLGTREAKMIINSNPKINLELYEKNLKTLLEEDPNLSKKGMLIDSLKKGYEIKPKQNNQENVFKPSKEQKLYGDWIHRLMIWVKNATEQKIKEKNYLLLPEKEKELFNKKNDSYELITGISYRYKPDYKREITEKIKNLTKTLKSNN